MVTSTANFTDSDKLSGTELTAKEKSLELVRGICVPASCSIEKVIEYSNRKFEELKATEAICRTNDAIPFKPIDIFAM
jgi:hypothetical protein